MRPISILTRTIGLATGILLLAALTISSSCSRSSQRPLVIASYGGDWQAAQKKTMFAPFADEYHVPVQDVVYDGQYGPILSQARAKDIKWDLADVEGNMVLLGEKDGILDPIDYSVVDASHLHPEAKQPYGVGIVAWSWVLAFNADVFSKNPPSTWQDFFDVQQFPGSRGLRNDPRRVLETALLADGVTSDRLYPIDVERALRKLDKLISDLKSKNFQLVWWTEYAQPPKLLADKEVVMTPAANGRIYAARTQENLPLAFSWQDGIVDLDWWVVLAGSPRRESAMKFINYASSTKAQSAIVTEIPYGPVNQLALDLLPNDVKQSLPTNPQNLAREMFFNTKWWSDNLERVQSRWNEWFAKAK